MHVLALVGRAGSGKDTLCEGLLQHFRGSKRFAFADALKDVCADILEMFSAAHQTRRLFDDRETKEREILDFAGDQVRLYERVSRTSRTSITATPRIVAQRVGTNILRHRLGPQVFPQVVVNRILEEAPPLAIITDARFPDEVEFLRKTFGSENVSVLRIRRRSSDEYEGGHESEREIERIPTDAEVANERTIEELIEATVPLVRAWCA